MDIRDHKEGATLAVHVIPNASRNALVRGEADRLVVRLSAPPVEGRANSELVKFLAKKLGIPGSCFRIIRGATWRDKVVLVSGVTGTELRGAVESRLTDA
ncbi:MAG: DUF167 domain-containing protein [Thermodesulfobacteriota bacterium]